ncbi:MAG: outer membrane lipid asymmetry maintenance protein MlaD [Paracoccaceae bacterium]|nr:outer membrane lipid asymmetry maintenance protein MlaD [Paracoccaceae bacterium]MDE2915247.1 outer membrane lipid asymmetry maintenance protein MlaD [Paracoccaceae bacterium]
MSEDVTEIVVGAAVIAVAAAFLVYAAGYVGQDARTDSYQLHASFRNVGGVSRGTDVRLAGIKIGTVTAMELDPEDYRAKVTFSIDRTVTIPADSAVRVAVDGLFGGYHFQIDPGADLESLGDGDFIEDSQGSINLLTLLTRVLSGDAER